MSSFLGMTSHTSMYESFKKQLFTDFSFICSDGEIGAHLLILKANCKWFQKNKHISSMGLPGYTKKVVSDFLTLLYVGEGTGKDPHSMQKLLDMFQCSSELKEQENSTCKESRQSQDDTAPPPAPPDPTPVHLLPNPFAPVKPVTSVSPENNVIKKKNDPNMSQLLIPPKTNPKTNAINSQEIDRRSSNSSDNSDILIIEDIHPVVEIDDSLTQQQFPVKVEKTADISEDLLLLQNCQKRKNDDQQIDDGKTLSNNFVTSSDTGNDLEPLRVKTTKLRAVNEAETESAPEHQEIKNDHNHQIDDNTEMHQEQSDSDSDESELNFQPKYSRRMMTRSKISSIQRNRFMFFSSSNDTTPESTEEY